MASLNPPRESGDIVRMRVRACYDRLVQNIRVCDHLDYWYQEGVIEMEDKQRISAEVTDNDKVRKALDIIIEKPDLQVVDFRASFEREKYSKHIGRMIDQQTIALKRAPTGDEADIMSESTKAKRRRPVTTPEAQGLEALSLSDGTTRTESFVLTKRTMREKKCRGCKSRFKKKICSPDDLVVRRTEPYEFFDKTVGKMKPTADNRYYHASASCLLSHGEQSVDNLVIPPDIELSDEHFALCAKRGLVLDRFVNKKVQ